MVEIKKIETEFGYWFDICIDDDIFKIFFMGNLDLYWKYQYSGSIRNTDSSKSFVITKESYFLFKLFDRLYNDIKSYNKDYHYYSYDLLFNNDKIEWCCDDCVYEEASSFIIEPMNEAYKLTFKRGLID